MKFFYVYILRSNHKADTFYTGFTENLENRINEHNQGKCPHTSKYKPWSIKTTIAFTDKERALKFEQYLKTASGRAFTKKRLWFVELSRIFVQKKSWRKKPQRSDCRIGFKCYPSPKTYAWLR